MVDEETTPRIPTMKATVRMPIYDCVNGLLEQNHCLPFMTYMFTNCSIYTETKDTFYIVEVYISQHTLHAQMERERMCMFSRGHISPTLAFDYDYEFTDQERSLQRVYRVNLRKGSTLTTRLQRFNFSTGFAWDYWVIYDLSELLKDLETEDPSTEAVRILYNWTTYVDYLIFDFELEDATKIKLLKAMCNHGYMPESTKATTRTKWTTFKELPKPTWPTPSLW